MYQNEVAVSNSRQLVGKTLHNLPVKCWVCHALIHILLRIKLVGLPHAQAADQHGYCR